MLLVNTIIESTITKMMAYNIILMN